MDFLRRWYRNRAAEPWVRPWGLAAPVLVLVVCLPMLRPLRYPYATDARQNENEIARLATVQSIVEHNTIAVDAATYQNIASRVAQTPGPMPALPTQNYNRQSPVLAALLAGPYWVMRRFGLSIDNNLVMVSYLLTLLGVTLPVAMAGGMIYRMGRLFELRRPWRMTLAIACIFGSGLVSYATVLNSNAPAAALVIAACASLFHAAITRHQARASGWLMLAGFTAGFAGVIDLGALVFLVLLVLVILGFAWPRRERLAGIGWYAAGAVPPLVMHVVLTVPLTGSIWPGFLYGQSPQPIAIVTGAPVTPPAADDEDLQSDSTPGALTIFVVRLVDGLLGPHGLLTHFPIVIVSVGGIGAVIHWHWPRATKALAAVCLLGAMLIVLGYAVFDCDWNQPMFATRWFIVFMPMLVYWAGPFLRRPHTPGVWTGAGVLLGFSILVSLLGASAPFTPAKPGQYTAYAALRELFRTPPAQSSPAPPKPKKPTTQR
jgi:MFS family permease